MQVSDNKLLSLRSETLIRIIENFEVLYRARECDMTKKHVQCLNSHLFIYLFL